MESKTEVTAKQGAIHTVNYMRWNEKEKTREWNIARDRLITNGILADNGTQTSVKHTFIVIDGRILAVSNQVLGRGAFGEVRYAEDEEGHAFALKRQDLHGFLGYRSETEAMITHDRHLTLRDTSIQQSNVSYIAYQYLGDMSLEKYIEQFPMSMDDALDISIQLALEMDDIHRGLSSQNHLKIAHNDIALKNMVIDSHNRVVHIVDFGLSKIVDVDDAPHGLNFDNDLWRLAACCSTVLSRASTRPDDPDTFAFQKIVSTFRDLQMRITFSSALELANRLTCQRISNAHLWLPATHTAEDIRAINFLHKHQISLETTDLHNSETFHVIKMCYTHDIAITSEHLTPRGIKSMLELEKLASPQQVTEKRELFSAFSQLSKKYNEQQTQEAYDACASACLLPLMIRSDKQIPERFGQRLEKTFKLRKITWKEQGNKVWTRFATMQTASNNFLAFLDVIEVNDTPIGGRSASMGSVFRLMEKFRELAQKANADKLIVQLDPVNERLGQTLAKRYQNLGKMPMLAVGHGIADIDIFDKSYQKKPFLTLEVNVKPKLRAIPHSYMPKCLVGLGVLASVGEVAASEDKLDTAIKEIYMHTGGFVGATVGAMYGAPLGPFGMTAGMLLGGAMGSEITEIAHRVIKKLPPQSDMTLIEFLKRLNPEHHEDASAKRTAEELFGEISENPLRRRHSSSELLSHANPVGSHLSHPFSEATIEPLSNEDLRQHTIGLFKSASVMPKAKLNRYQNSNKRTIQTMQASEQESSERVVAKKQYYERRYELSERVKKIREHLRTGEPLQLSRPTPTFSEGCKAISSAANDLALIANAWHLPGGRELSIIGKGTERIAAGSLLLCMENAPAFATPLGWLSIVAGIAVLTTLGDEADENDAIAELKLALVQLGMMLKQVLQNQQKIADTLDVILKSVLDVEARVKQHQTETRATLSFISTYQLQDACLAIQGDLAKTNAVSLTSDARRAVLSILERWLNQHLFHAGISREASGPTSSKLAVETLASYPAMNTMGFILVQLQAHLGAEHVPNEFVHLPPLNLYIHVAQLFLTSVLSAELPSDDGCEALCKKLVDVVQTYAKLIDYLRTELVVWDALFAQYEHQRNRVGRALFAANIPNQAVPIDSLVTNDLKRRNLMDTLDQMEERRLLLVRLVEFAFDGGVETVLHQKIKLLESKQHILYTHASTLYTVRNAYYPNSGTKTSTCIQQALRSGVDLNTPSDGGNILNYMGYLYITNWIRNEKHKQMQVDLCHNLLKHATPSEPLNADLVSLYHPGGSWWKENYAMRMYLNCGQYNIPLLMIIAGFETPNDAIGWDYSMTGNLVKSNGHSEAEIKMLLSSTIRTGGLLNRYKLRRAFQYYQTVVNGEMAQANQMFAEGVDVYCVLWLVALLGNWPVFERLHAQTDYVKTVGTFQFIRVSADHPKGFVGYRGILPRYYEPGYLTTDMARHTSYGSTWPITSRYTPLMIAAEHGRIDVIEGLIQQQEAGFDIGIPHTLAWGASAATLAFTQGHFDIAQRLYDLGSPLTTQEVDALNAKALPHTPLTVEPNPLLAMLERSRIETHDSLQTDSLNDMVSSIQDFSMIFKQKFNAKIRLLEQAFAEQEKLFKHCVAFDAVVHRVQILVLNQMLSPNVLEHLRESQMQLHSLFYRLQKQLQKIAETYHVEYEGMAYTPKLDAPTLIAHDELSNISAIRQQLLSAFETRVSSLANDLGISLDKTLDLIHDLADYLQRMPATTKESALILFGSTGVGKSTLFNFLTGCLYQEEINEEDGNVFREKISGVELSEVGHGAQAKTIFPIVADLPDKPYALIDMPGSTDNRGKKDASMMSPYDLSAAVSMKYVIKSFDTIKGILVVCPDDQLTPERPPLELQEVFQQVGRMIMDKPHLSANIMLGITKQGRRTLKQVLGRLRNIAKAFTEDEAMSTFLNAFLQDPNAEGRLLFMDVISEPERACYFDRFDEKFMPQPTKDYHFEEYSHRLDKLRRLLTQLSESRQQSHQELMEQQLELDVLNSLEETQQRNLNIEATIPQFLLVDSHDLSLDELAQFQNQLLYICERTTQLNGLLHRIHRIEEALTHKKELSQKIEQLKCQEEIESDFHQRLGLLCVYQDEHLTSSSTVSIRGTLFNPNRSNVHQHSSQHAATVTQDYTV